MVSSSSSRTASAVRTIVPPTTPRQPTVAELQARIAELEAAQAGSGKLSIKIGPEGTICVYGLNTRFPVSLYLAQWERLLGYADDIRAFAASNTAYISHGRDDKPDLKRVPDSLLSSSARDRRDGKTAGQGR